MEEVFGEYVLNMSKESIRIAAMKGEIKLNDVQLDGDLVGSHFFGLVGLSNFGILSCSAKSLRISVPWKQLEKEPTRFDIDGVHLVCVPLLPSTANKTYGSGSAVDPRCTLRTRAKRLTLARLERNFWNGQIPGEGPPLKRVSRAAKDVERELRRSMKKDRTNLTGKKQRSRSFSSTSFRAGSINNAKSVISSPKEYAEMEEALDDLVYKISQEESIATSEDEGSIQNITDDDLPHLPRDWKVKLREKVMRNLEAVMKNVHIRCEVPQSTKVSNQRETSFAENYAFAFGFTLESLVVRTANESWEAGCHDMINPKDGSEMSSVKDHLGPNEYVVVNNKIGYFNKLSMYWDSDPPILLSETDALQGNFSNQPLDKLSTQITAAMEALHHGQEIGVEIRQSLSISIPT
jgi:Vacuolar sorting-associated protein 13, N-terminal/N-terminal region of Chorein or VPS13